MIDWKAQRNKLEKLSRVRQFVFGSLDGLLVPLGVMSTVAGASTNSHTVIIAGLAEAFAGALSMGAGEFISGRAEAQVQLGAINEELAEIKNQPDQELAELIAMLEDDGLRQEDALAVAKILEAQPEAFTRTMVQKELGLNPQVETVKLADSFIMGASYLAASMVPMVSYFFLPLHPAYLLSLVFSFIFLIVVGIIKGKLANINLLISVIETLLIGVISGFGGYVLGTFLPTLFTH